jgi:hypothetical protein
MNNDFGPAPIGPFPLQMNLRKLKPNLGGVILPVLTVIIFALQGPIQDFEWKDLESWQGYVVFGVAVVALIIGTWLVSELALKKIYYNERGIGIDRAGSTPAWYSFDELREANIKRTARGRGKSGDNTLKLEFHTGKLTIHGALYDKAQVQELAGIVADRRPGPVEAASAPEASGGGRDRGDGSGRRKEEKMPKRGVYPSTPPSGLPDVKPPEVKPPWKRKKGE